VHKAQGSEWRKVFIILHKDFAVSLYRELFYTAATRARTKVTIIANDTTIAKAISSQRIKGDTLKDKMEYFNSGADLRDNVYCTKN
jgi:exodeoxyribonuclease V alpha subunit